MSYGDNILSSASSDCQESEKRERTASTPWRERPTSMEKTQRWRQARSRASEATPSKLASVVRTERPSK
jgi:hypothetical protein